MNTTVTAFASVQPEIQSVEELMLTQTKDQHDDLKAALELIIKSGGKRIRPTISLLVGHMLGAPQAKLITLAAAIELLHTATLVHDDLIDGSLLRRGMPTLNSQWSPGATVLTGDFIFARAAKLAADTESVPVMKIFSQTLSTIVNGEITQLFGKRYLTDKEIYYRRIYSKTASLFETSAWSAALISQADPDTIEATRKFGYNIGMAFQIIDDILDFTGAEETIGKPVGSDLKQGLVTLPALYFLENHPETPEARLLLEGSHPDYEKINCLVNKIRGSNAIHSAHTEACRFVNQAIEILQNQHDSQERRFLEEIATFIIDREL